jgi:chromosomal replication initiation ATPase DnaA
MEIIRRKDYIEIDIPYDEIEEYKDIIEILEFKKNIKEINVPDDVAEEIMKSVNEDLRVRAKESLKRLGIETGN